MNVVAHCLLRGSFRSVAGLFCPDTSKHRAIEAIAARCRDACGPYRRFERSLKDDQRLSRSHRP
ncbi:regulatory protein GntR, HTH [Burkholderia multivorans CGD1]|nr:regulatory protein GntR, HTH [Burkholderia multivorans CGD1]